MTALSNTPTFLLAHRHSPTTSSSPSFSHSLCSLWPAKPIWISASTTESSAAITAADPSMHHSSKLLSFFQELGLNDKEAHAVLLNGPSLSYASLLSLEDRVLLLQSVGISGWALCHLVIKRAEVLTASEIDPFLRFVAEHLEGLKPMKLKLLLSVMEPRYLVGFAEKVELLAIHGIPRDKLAGVINGVNLKVFCYREPQEIERVVIFVKRFGLNWIIRRPALLNLDLEAQLVPRVGFLAELGGDDKATELLRKFAPILAYSVEHMQSHLDFWSSVGLTDEQYFRILLVYPNVFSVSRDRKLGPRIEFLRQCGLNAEDIYKFLTKAPLYLSLSYKANLSKKLGILVKLGYREGTRELASAMGAVTRTSCENMQMLVGVLLGYGFSCEDIMVMSKKHPQVLQYNYESLQKKMEYLIEEMDREIGELLAFPAFLGYKLDERIKHRYEAKKDVRGSRMSLNKLLSVPTERFASKK